MQEPVGITKVIDNQNDIETGYLQAHNPICQEKNLQDAEGFVYILPRGHAILITSALCTYHVSMQHVMANKLKTGDQIEAKTDEMGICEVTAVRHIGFDKAKALRPNVMRKIGNFGFKLGGRILLRNRGNFDFIEYIAKNQKQTNPSYKIALLVDESEDCIDYLKDSGTNEIYLAKVNFNIKKKILMTISAILTAKQYAAKGKNVIFFIDNLNKLFKLYNSSVDTNTIDITKVNIGPLTDLKTLFMEAKQLENKGSLTIIANMLAPTNDIEKFVLDDFLCLANNCFDLN